MLKASADKTLIRQVLDSRIESLHAKGADLLIAPFARDVVSFELPATYLKP